MRPGGLRSAPFVRTGLWLYRRVGSNLARLQPAEDLAASRRQLEQMLDTGRQLNVFSYEDAQCEFPERLVAEWLREAIAAGCVARNYTQVIAIECSGGSVRALRHSIAITCV